MTEQERLKTDVVFIDTVIRECALMTIQKEADALKIEELEQRLEATSSPTSLPLDETRANALQQKLNEVIADLHFVMSGGDPCKVCATKCNFGEEHCKPIWRGEAGDGQ